MRKMPFVTSVATKAVITVQSYENRELQGMVFSPYYGRAIPFHNAVKMVDVLESLFDSLRFPQASVKHRSFSVHPRSINSTRKAGEYVEDKEKCPQGKAKFVVHVQFRQNATWQGTIQWVEKNKTQRFRSTLEMLKLMDEVLGADDQDREISFLAQDEGKN